MKCSLQQLLVPDSFLELEFLKVDWLDEINMKAVGFRSNNSFRLIGASRLEITTPLRVLFWNKC